MELSNLSFQFAKDNGYHGENDIYDVLLFFKEQKNLNFEVIKTPDGIWNGFVRKDPSIEAIRKLGFVEPIIIFQTEMVTCLTDEEALDLLISYFDIYNEKNHILYW